MADINRYLATPEDWLRSLRRRLTLLLAVVLVVGVPLSLIWLWMSGDMSPQKAIRRQVAGENVLFGSGLEEKPLDSLAYRMGLVRAVSPKVVVMGSASGQGLRQAEFTSAMINLAGSADSLSELQAGIDVLLQESRPKVVVIGVDFWWFAKSWEPDPFVDRRPRDPYAFSLTMLRKPWEWLAGGLIGPGEFLAPLLGAFRGNRLGILAQKDDDGYAADGSWHPTSLVMGRAQADQGFMQTRRSAQWAMGRFVREPELSSTHVDAFADIYFRLLGRGVVPVVYISPVAGPVYDVMKQNKALWPHLFGLGEALTKRGMNVLDASDPRMLAVSDCEFLDGVRMGEVGDARILRELSNRSRELGMYVDSVRVAEILGSWQGHAWVRDSVVNDDFEIDFLGLGCRKKTR